MKPSNKELIKRLQYARELICSGKKQWVCLAVSPVDQDHVIRDWVKAQLDGCSFYGTWLLNNHPEFFEEHKYEGLGTGRLQWIDAMIKELENE